MQSLSIIIPLYNKQQSVAATLACVKAQTYSEFECIIVDDGSTDDSVNVVRREIADDNRFLLFRKTNGGVSSARNEGIKLARYDHIAFLDADDYWAPDYLQEMVRLINDFPQAGLWGMGWNFMTDGVPAQVADDTYSYYRGMLTNYWSGNRSYWTSACCTSKAVLQTVGLFDERIAFGEDIDLWYRILVRFQGAYYAKPLAFYVQDAENRAFLHRPALEKNIVCYMEKFAVDRKKNMAFRRFFDPLMASHLFPYLDAPEYRTDSTLRYRVNHLRTLLDKSLLSRLCLLRLYCPWLFRMKRKLTYSFGKLTR